MAVIPAFGRQTQKDQKFKVIFIYISKLKARLGYVRSCLKNRQISNNSSKELEILNRRKDVYWLSQRWRDEYHLLLCKPSFHGSELEKNPKSQTISPDC